MSVTARKLYVEADERISRITSLVVIWGLRTSAVLLGLMPQIYFAHNILIKRNLDTTTWYRVIGMK